MNRMSNSNVHEPDACAPCGHTWAASVAHLFTGNSVLLFLFCFYFFLSSRVCQKSCVLHAREWWFPATSLRRPAAVRILLGVSPLISTWLLRLFLGGGWYLFLPPFLLCLGLIWGRCRQPIGLDWFRVLNLN